MEKSVNSNLQRIVSTEKLIIVTSEKAHVCLDGEKLPCAKGYYAGAVVNAADWHNKALAAVHGEAVYVNPSSQELKFASKTPVVCLVHKRAENLSCVGKVFDNIVRWI